MFLVVIIFNLTLDDNKLTMSWEPITWEISARAETECESGNRCLFICIVVHRGSTHAFMNFQPGLKHFSDYMAKFSARAEISARLAPTGLKILQRQFLMDLFVRPG